MTEPADRRVAHRLPDLAQEYELVVARADSRTRREAGEQLLLADRPDATGDALPARLVPEELGDSRQGGDQVRSLVERP